MIDRLLHIYPEAARRVLPGKRPRTPFCKAIASGLEWHINTREGPLLRLWRCVPEALHSRDMETGLYPFLLAATVKTHSDDVSDLNNVYNMLRLYPQAIQASLFVASRPLA